MVTTALVLAPLEPIVMDMGIVFQGHRVLKHALKDNIATEICIGPDVECNAHGECVPIQQICSPETCTM